LAVARAFKYNKCIGSIQPNRGHLFSNSNLNTINVSVQWTHHKARD